jgi:hypothetical protein
VEDPEHPELFLIFRDATSAHGSYPAGRFLYADMPKAGKVILDFNRAFNPPCAFTAFATCPLPPKQNHLTSHRRREGSWPALRANFKTRPEAYLGLVD